MTDENRYGRVPGLLRTYSTFLVQEHAAILVAPTSFLEEYIESVRASDRLRVVPALDWVSPNFLEDLNGEPIVLLRRSRGPKPDDIETVEKLAKRTGYIFVTHPDSYRELQAILESFNI